MSDETKSNLMPFALGGAAVIVVGIALFLSQTPSETVETVVAPVAQTTSEDTAAAPDVVAQAPDAPVTVEPLKPQFDTFRVETDGSMVIAGRAEPNQMVDIILAGRAIERVTADQSGAFVAFPIADPSELPRRLTLLADPEGDKIASDTSFMVSPIAAPLVVTEQDVTPEVPTAPAQEEVANLPETIAPELPDVVAEAEDPVAPAPSPTVLQADSEGIRVVQSSPSLVAPNVALDAITYDPEGEVQLAGRATGDGAVQVYIDNQPVTASPVQQGGDWQIDLPDIDTGVYTLRIDEVDPDGAVVSRLETPFKREEAAEVAAVLAEETAQDGFEVAVKTVQPGATLWAIAEENLGSGIFYVEVFEANADLIRDPDLIYPGQIFRMPEISQ